MDRYWVGGSGTWNTTSTTNWSATSGGGSGASVPTVADSVFFDQAGTYTVTMTGALACLDITVSAGTVTFATGTTPTLDVRGSMSLLAGTVWSSTGAITFSSTTTGRTITTNGTVLTGAFSGGAVTFNGAGGGWTLGSALTVGGGVSTPIAVTQGTLDTAGFNITTPGSFSSAGSLTRSLVLGASTISSGLGISGNAWNVTSTGLTLNAGTSTIVLGSSANNFSGAGLTYYNLTFAGTGPSTRNVTGANTFNNFVVTGPSSAGVAPITFDSQQTINGTLSTTGTAGNRRVFFASATYGISVDLVVNSAPSLTDADFRGLYVRGTAAPISGTRIGNRGECRGITFSTPKTVYWNLGGSNNWNADAWAATSGGGLSTDNFPLPQDTAIVDNANPTVGNTISMGTTAGYLPTVDFSNRTVGLTFSPNAPVSVYGNWTNGSGISISVGTSILTFSGGTTQTITSAGKTFTSPITIDTYGGTVQLADALNIGGGNNLAITNGTFNSQGYSVSVGNFLSANSNVRTISFGASTINIAGGIFNLSTATNLTFNAGTSQINFTAGSGSLSSGIPLTFYNFSFTATNTTSIDITGSIVFNNLTFTAPASAGLSAFSFSGNQTINGTLTCAGASAVRRIFLRSNTIGTPRTLTVNAISATDCDFRDIILAGAASGASPTRAGDCGGNTGITFPAPKTVYWNLAGAQNWSATGWCPSSGGTPNINNFPLAQDTAVFDNTGSVTGTITINAAWNIGTLDASLRTSAMTLNAASNSPSIYGNWTFGTGVTQSSNPGAITFSKNGTQTITSNGVQFGCPVTINHPLANVQLADALSFAATRTLTLNAGTFDAVTYNVTTSQFANNSSSNTVRMGSGTWTLSGSGTVWNMNGSPTLIVGTSTIVLSDTSTSSRTFVGGSLYYNKLTIGGATGTSTLTINNNNTFGELASTKTVAHTIDFGITVQTFGKWSVTGTAGNVVTITGTSTTNFIAGPAVTGVDYLAMGTWGVSTTSPGEFYAGANSTGTAAAPVFRTAAPAPRTLYWVGGTGNWSSTTKWSTSSGGGSGAAIPTSLDAVIFDSASNATAYTATIDAGVTLARCASFTMAGPLVGNVTFAGSVGIAFHGTVSRSASGVTITYTGTQFLSGNGSYTFNGVGTFSSPVTVLNVGATWTLSGAVTCNQFLVSSGGINLSTYTLTVNTGFTTTSTSVAAIDFSSGTVTCTNSSFFISPNPNITFSAGTSTITIDQSPQGFTGGGRSYNTVRFPLTTSGTHFIGGANTFNTLFFGSVTSVGIKSITFDSNQTINTLTLNAGTASAYRTFLASNTIGTTRTLTVGTLTAGAADIDFRDITIAGAAAPISGTRFGDAKGNSGITFDAAKTVYWAQPVSNNWGFTGVGCWSATNGGAATNTQFPLAQDTAFIPFAVPNNNQTITVNAAYNIGTIDMNERNGSALVTMSTSTGHSVYGNWINGTGTTLTGTGTLTFAGRGSQTITSAGKTFTQRFNFNTPGGSVTLQDAASFNANSVGANTITAGTFDANGYNVTTASTINGSCGITTSGALAKTLAIGSGTWSIGCTGSAWNNSGTNVTVTGTGTITLTNSNTKTFVGGDISYSGITVNQGGAGALTISGNNTFKNITNTYSATGATTINFGATTQTLTNPWTATGEAGRVLTVSGTSAASPATLIFSGSGTAANVDYLAINNVRAYDLVDEWYAGANSTNGGSLGWYFVAAGGTVYAVTITETGTGTDAITAKVTLLGTISETGTGTDSISSSFLFLGAVSESATVTDSNFAKFQPKANITETATGSDVESAILSAISLIAETATGSDTDLARLVAGATLTETATGTDTDAAALTVRPTITETATGSDTETARYIAHPVISETATGTDTEAAKLTVRPSIIEAATGSDTDSAKLTANSNLSETATGADTDSARMTAQSVIAELATITDAASARATLLAAVIEAATITDLPSSIKGLFAYILESVTATDSITAPGSTYNPRIAETATASDSIVALAIFAARIVEVTNASDVIAAFKAYFSTILETASGADEIAAQFVASTRIDESATGTDAETTRMVILRLVLEAATAADAYSAKYTVNPSVDETGTASDAVSPRYIARPSILETGNASDAITTRATLRSIIAESALAQEIVQATKTMLARINELATGTDRITALRALAVSIAESAILYEGNYIGTNYDTPGSGTFTVPSGVTTLVAELWGGGAGGTSSDPFQNGTGGGSGAYARKSDVVTPGQVLSFTVGSGGIGGFSFVQPTTSGTASTYSTVSAGGGLAGGAGGTATGGDVNLSGGVGVVTAGGVAPFASGSTPGGGGAGGIYSGPFSAYGGSNGVAGRVRFSYVTGTPTASVNFVGRLQELATAQDLINAPGSTYSAPIAELASLLDAALARAIFPTSVTETATGTETVRAAFIPYARITETATITDVASALSVFAARTVESAYVTDQVSPPGSIYNPVVLAVAQLVDRVSPPGSVYNAPVLESATITDSLIGGFLWIDVNDDQIANWGDVNDSQTTTWLAVDDSQTTNWQNVNNTQTSGWTDVNDTQTPVWKPVLP